MNFDFIHLVILLVFCRFVASSQNILRIGGVFPILDSHGEIDPVGAQRQAAFLMAINEINNKTDGILDHILPNIIVKYAVRDSLRTFSNTVLAALNLDGQLGNIFNGLGVQGVIGAGDNSVSEALATVFAGVDLAQISYGSSATELSHSDIYPLFLRVFPADGYQGTIFANIISQFNWHRVGIFCSSDTFGSDSLTEFIYQANQLGITVDAVNQFSVGKADFSKQILNTLPFDLRVFVFLISSPSDASNLLVQGWELGLFHSGVTLFFPPCLAVPKTWTGITTQHGQAAMVGSFFLQPMIQSWKLSPQGKAYLKRFVSLPPTVQVHPNGSQVCLEDQDDTGYFLYKAYSSNFHSYLCSGLIYSNFSPDGSDSSTYMGFVYDATVSFFVAIDQMLRTGDISPGIFNSTNSSNISGKMIKKYMVDHVSFMGLTGPIGFSSGRIGSNIYGFGDRSQGLGFVLTNYQVANSSSGDLFEVGNVLEGKGFIPCDPSQTPLWMSYHGCNSIMFNSPDGSQPPDRRADTYQVMPVFLKALVLVLGGALAIFILCVAVYVLHLKRRTRLVRASQPIMLCFILLSSLIGAIRVMVTATNISKSTCLIRLWLGHTCFLLVFFSFFIKTWRVFMIVRSGLKKIQISSSRTSMYLLSLSSLFWIYLALYTYFRPSKPFDFQTRQIFGNINHEYFCQSDLPILDYVLYSLEALALLITSWLCYLTRNVPDAVNESSYISIAVYSIAFICVIGLPLILKVGMAPFLMDLLTGLCFFLAVLLEVLFYFSPKIHLLLQGADLNAQFKIVIKESRKDNYEKSEAALRESEEDELFRSEIPPNVSILYCRRRASLWMEEARRLEAKLFMHGSGGSFHSSSKHDEESHRNLNPEGYLHQGSHGHPHTYLPTAWESIHPLEENSTPTAGIQNDNNQ